MRVFTGRTRGTSWIVFLIAGLGLFVVLCRYLGLGELSQAAARADPWRLVAFLALSVAVFLTYAKRWSIILVAMGGDRPPLPLHTLLGFRAAAHAVSAFRPSAHLSGEPMRSFLLRRRRQEWVQAIASVVMDRMLDLTASSVLGPAYAMVFFLANDASAGAEPWVIGGMIVCFAALAGFYLHSYRGGALISLLARRGWFWQARASLESIDHEITEFLRSRSFFVALALSFLAEGLIIAELWTLAAAFSWSISLSTLLGVTVGMGIAQLVPIPASIGSLEATEVGVLTLAGGSASLGLAVGLAVRMRETLWILVGLVVLYIEGLSWRSFAEVAAPTFGNRAAIEPKA
ncbi:MAG TPA: lysylphosphatidylglycerol synthase transmembrane domain-containing protein [Candidatus Binatia bacterium]|nr:lysylphosphatidylglycerol synthase transmembrane domain-containing protein [Candidatus Binatia bacterium]